MLLFLPALLLLPSPAPAPLQDFRTQPPALRFQKSLRLPVKPKPVMSVAPQRQKDRPGTTVVVHGDAQSLESVREQSLREFRTWLIANRFHGSAFVPALQPAFITTASWEQAHPGGFTVAPLATLGRSY